MREWERVRKSLPHCRQKWQWGKLHYKKMKCAADCSREKDKYMFGCEIDVEKAFSKQRRCLWVYWWKLDALYVFVYVRMYWCLVFLDIFHKCVCAKFSRHQDFSSCFCFATLWTFSFVLFIKSLQNVAVKASFLIFPREIFSILFFTKFLFF